MPGNNGNKTPIPVRNSMIKSWFSTYRKHFIATLLLAWPVILGQLGHIVIGLVDNAMIGQLGPTELSASAFGNSLFFLVLVIGLGLCMGISPLVAQAQGEGDEVKSGRFLHMSVRLTILVGIILTLITFGLSWLVDILPHKNPEVLPLAKQYLQIVNFSTVPLMVFLAYRHFVEGFSWMIPGMLVMGFVVMLNVFLNWIMIFGHWGIPAMGLAGGAWATVISRTVGMFIMIWVVAASPVFKKYNPLNFFAKNHFPSMKEVLKIGLPTGFQLFFEVGSFTGALFMAGLIGKIDQSAHQIAIGLASFTYMVYAGISASVSIRVGGAFGKKNMKEVREMGIAGLTLGLAFIAVFFVLLFSLRNIFPVMFIRLGEEEVIAIASRLLVIAGFFQLGDAIQVIALGALRGISDVKIPTFLTFLAYWGVGLPLGYVLAFPLGLGVDGLWYSLTAGLLFSAIVMTIRFLRLSDPKRAKNVASSQ